MQNISRALVHRQREFLVESAKSRVLFQAQLLAADSLHGAMSDDLGALSEIIGVLAKDRGIAGAMVTDARGRVLANTEAGNVGLFRNDKRTLTVLSGAPQSVLVDEGSHSIEAAAPILAQDRVVGWAWVARNLGAEQAHLAYVTHAGLVYTAAAILIGTLFAFLLAGIVTRQLRLLLAGTKRMAANRLDQEVAVTTENEVGEVTRAFNDAMHKLSQQQVELRESEEQFRGLAEGIPQLAWTANPDGWIYLVQPALVSIHRHHPATDGRLGLAVGTRSERIAQSDGAVEGLYCHRRAFRHGLPVAGSGWRISALSYPRSCHCATRKDE